MSLDQVAEFLGPLSATFGFALTPERVERLRGIAELDVLVGAYEGDSLVGSTGAFDFELTVPGGVAVPTAGLTHGAVLPTHRRRGLLRMLVRSLLEGAHRRGQPLAALYGLEGIHWRFGFGIAARSGEIELRKEHAILSGARTAPGEGETDRFRLVTEAEAATKFPPVYDRARRNRLGMLSRSDSWWRLRRLSDPAWLRADRPPLQRVLLERENQPVAYALYRFGAMVTWAAADLPLDVVECIGESPAALRAMWQYLFEIDLVRTFRATRLPLDHPLFFQLADPSPLRLQLRTGLWIRLVDVGAALPKRSYAAAVPLVIEVSDEMCPWNQGRWYVSDRGASRTEESADLVMDVATLGAAYLGAFTFSQLAQAGNVSVRSAGALAKADALFRADLLPWCPELF